MNTKTDDALRSALCPVCGKPSGREKELFCSGDCAQAASNQWFEKGYSALLVEEKVEIINWPNVLDDYVQVSDAMGKANDMAKDIFQEAVDIEKMAS